MIYIFTYIIKLNKLYDMSKLNDNFKEINGVYKLSNSNTGLIYIGSSNNLKRRLKKHLYEFTKGIHKNYKMQKDFNKYGIDSFNVEILFELEDIEMKDLRILEQQYVDKYDSFNSGYNLVPVDLFCFSHEELSKFAKQGNTSRQKKVKAFNKDTGEFIKEYESVSDAARALETSSSNISRTCKGEINYIKGCVLCYSDEYDPNKNYIYIKQRKIVSEETKEKMRQSCSRNKIVYKYDLQYNLIKTYVSRAECEREEGFKKEFLRRRLPYTTESYILSSEKIS